MPELQRNPAQHDVVRNERRSVGVAQIPNFGCANLRGLGVSRESLSDVSFPTLSDDLLVIRGPTSLQVQCHEARSKAPGHADLAAATALCEADAIPRAGSLDVNVTYSMLAIRTGIRSKSHRMRTIPNT